jgi:hypothetical protein
MSGEVQVKLYLEHVKVVVDDATAEVLGKLAFAIEREAKLNIRNNDQIDTGFMVNSVYAVTGAASSYSAAKASAQSQTRDRGGHQVDHSGDMAPEQGLPADADAAVVIGANYAIYQEAAKPFLYPAAQKAAAQFGGQATAIYKQVLPDERPTNG